MRVTLALPSQISFVYSLSFLGHACDIEFPLTDNLFSISPSSSYYLQYYLTNEDIHPRDKQVVGFRVCLHPLCSFLMLLLFSLFFFVLQLLSSHFCFKMSLAALHILYGNPAVVYSGPSISSATVSSQYPSILLLSISSTSSSSSSYLPLFFSSSLPSCVFETQKMWM